MRQHVTNYAQRHLEAPRVPETAFLVLSLGIVYSLFLNALANAGHVPSATHGLPVNAENYYRVASWYIAPLFVVLWLLFSACTHLASTRLGGNGHLRNTSTLLGVTYAGPILFVFVIPDFLTFTVWGHSALKYVFPYFGIATLLVLCTASTYAVSKLYGISKRRAFGAVFAGLVAQGIPATLLIR